MSTEEKICAVNAVFPAFPCQPRGQSGDPCGELMPGLTKRELFAAMAMQGAMHALAIQADQFEVDESVDPHPIARDAVRMADALLKELAK